MKIILALTVLLSVFSTVTQAREACPDSEGAGICIIDVACVNDWPAYTLQIMKGEEYQLINSVDVRIDSKTMAYICSDDDFSDSINSKKAANAVKILTLQAQQLKAGGLCKAIIVNVK